MNAPRSALTSAGFRHSRRGAGFVVRAESQMCANGSVFAPINRFQWTIPGVAADSTLFARSEISAHGPITEAGE
jgi:aspartyl/asparaginyl beta-hydroxylase (cupin superfamily)